MLREIRQTWKDKYYMPSKKQVTEWSSPEAVKGLGQAELERGP